MYRSPFTLLYFTGSINGYRRRNYNTIGFRGEEERPKNLGSLVSFMVPKGRGGGWKKKERKEEKGLTGTEHVRVWSSTCVAFLVAMVVLYRGVHET